eukprot:TRINITY_DN25706_c0_g1_i2.p1 TRINITY_DN25706_c0_g1~~TRINITY_DN25706_c0_g1_i2.p1  ORF type:complete len:454 (+),score=104.16 TRINITY_DN25706_c0_g1_i2:86-1447(+)
MGQCVARDVQGALASSWPCCATRGWDLPAAAASSSGKAARGVSTEEMEEALLRFRQRGDEALARSGRQGDLLLWSTACEVFEALLGGVQRHVPEVCVSVDVVDRESSRAASRLAPSEVVAIVLRLGVPQLVGEIATRSRVCGELRLSQEVRLALLRPPPTSDGERDHRKAKAAAPESPLEVSVSGLAFPKIEEVAHLRARLESELGDSFDRHSAYAWWLKNKDEEFPLQHSKFRRVYESFFRHAPLPRWACEKGFWGFINATTLEASFFKLFRFHHDGKGSVEMTALRHPPTSPADVAQMAICDAMCRDVLLTDRPIAERFSPSSMNYMAMVWGRDVNQPGADPHKIAKLFAAADSWGPGPSGWHKLDDTWLCVDEKNAFGRVTKEQGRTIWRAPTAAAAAMPPRLLGSRLAQSSSSNTAEVPRAVALAAPAAVVVCALASCTPALASAIGPS